MFSSTSFLQRLYITIFITVLSLPSSNGVNERYKTCSSSSFSCGHNVSNVGYPFWGDMRPQYCGHPSFQLICLNNSIRGDYPILKIGREDHAPYTVLSIKFSDTNISLKLQWYKNIPCTAYLKDFTKSFKFSPNVQNITLLYKCPSVETPSDDLRGPVPCLVNSIINPAYYLYNISARKNFASCRSFEVPVFRKQLYIFKNGVNRPFSEVLEQGFEVNYMHSEECLKCSHSGGICGSSSPDSNFVCLCEYGDFADVCSNHFAEKWKLIHAIGILGVLLIFGLVIGLCCKLKAGVCSPVLVPFLTRTISTDSTTSDLETDIGSSFHGVPVFHYNELKEATKNFDTARKIGDGGCGIVYYGKLGDGREVAVKRLYENNDKKVGQFMNEVEILAGLRHPNLVTLCGCTSQQSRELLLVYEYISNGTVADHLHGDRSGSGALTWDLRMKIAVETASALSHLHNSGIVHRDVKTDNILLDDNFSVKVVDFGLSRLFPVNMTHVSTAPQGTLGYLDPQYYKCFKVTIKSDVYSFGVVLVELISSLPAADVNRHEDEFNLSDYAMNRIKRGAIHELVDQKLGFDSDFKVKRTITLVAELASSCLQQEKDCRPSMDEVLERLVRVDRLDFEALEEDEMNEKQTSLAVDKDIHKSLPSSSSHVGDDWGN